MGRGDGESGYLVRQFSASLLLVATLVATMVATSARADDESQDITGDTRYIADPDTLNYGHPVDVEQNYTHYLEDLEIPDPSHWGGAYVDGDKLVVTFIGMTQSAASREIATVGIRGAVTLQRASYSMAAMNDEMRTAMSLDGLAGTVTGAIPDTMNSRLIIEFADPSSVTAARLEIDPVAALSVVAPSMPTTDDLNALDRALDIPFVATVTVDVPVGTASRYYDTSPFHGGAAIKVSANASEAVGCSIGYAWNPPTGVSGQLFVTAAHCREEGDGTIRTIVSRYNGPTTSTTTKIGDVIWTSGDAGGTRSGSTGDFAIVKLVSGGTSTSGWVYHGTNDTSTLKQVVTPALALPTGWVASSSQKMYTSGAGGKAGNGDGQAMPDHVTATNSSMTYIDGLVTGRNQTFTGLTIAEHNSDFVQAGDSGGAVYLINSSGLRPLGIISGNNATSRGTLNARSYYTPLATVTSRYGGSVKPG